MNTTQTTADKGFLLIDKPEGITSFDVIRHLRRITKLRRIGHCGTLDPFATGLLVCTLGSYTRLSQFIEAQSKEYNAQIKLGAKTDSGDRTGSVIETNDIGISEVDSHNICAEALSIRELPVPAYSAVKIDGVRSYKLARQGIAPEMPARLTTISKFQFLKIELPYISYSCTVSKGTYIRSLSEWVAERFGSVGHTIELRRTAIGDIRIEDAVSLESLDETNWRDRLYPAQRVFERGDHLTLTEESLIKLMQGKIIPNEGEDCATIMIFDSGANLCSVCDRKDNLLKPRINLP
ncbi:MAG: tRNA pseudouridine(55) synthase TruB [Candidatus Cloacimonadaceae bacterium]|nr:tRNA pseudouridine(55) synthase TruB [Candidatus Cloacimonadaceae bacterium]